MVLFTVTSFTKKTQFYRLIPKQHLAKAARIAVLSIGNRKNKNIGKYTLIKTRGHQRWQSEQEGAQKPIHHRNKSQSALWLD